MNKRQNEEMEDGTREPYNAQPTKEFRGSEIDILHDALNQATLRCDKIEVRYSQLLEDIKSAKVSQGHLSAHLKRQEAELSEKISNLVKHLNEEKMLLLAKFEDSLKLTSAAFSEQQATSAPVELWTAKQEEHEIAKKRSFFMFLGGLVVTTLMICGVIYVLATQAAYVESLLAPIGCNPTKPEAACSGFSLKGALISVGVLTLFTLTLWFTRLQMKLYLAERHLTLDARERRAFAQSYIGLVREGDTSEEAREQRALVYAALFRPASDGTVREDAGLDPSVVAAVSKLLTK